MRKNETRTLGRDHPEEVTAWLKEMYVLHRATPRPAWDLARAALDIGGPALNLVLRAVQDHPEHSGILMLGDMAVERLDSSDALVESFADVLLNESSFSRLVHVESPLTQICIGINEENAHRRILVSGGREPPPPALLEPYVTVSRHTAPTVRRSSASVDLSVPPPKG